MSRRTTTIYLPCETFEVDVLAGPSDVVSPIEQLALRLVTEGIDSIRDLDGLVGLGPRPTLDLVFGLWRRGYLSLDPSAGRIAVTSRVREAIAAGTVEQLAGGELKSVRVSLMQELVAGTVVAAGKSSFSPSGYKTSPPLLPAGSFRRTSTSAFRRALERAVNQRSRGGREQKVYQSSLPLDVGAAEAPAGRRAFLRLEVACSEDPDTGRLFVRVLFPTWLPFGAQAAIGTGLARVAERYPRHPAVLTLRDQLDTAVAARPRTPAALVAGLRDAVGRLGDLPAAERFDRHSELVDLSEAAARLLGSEADLAQELHPVIGSTALDQAMERVARGASKQLVLACPWIRANGFRRWYRLVRELIEERPDLQVFIFWGISPTSALDEAGALGEWLEDLRATGRVHISQRASNTHAKLAVGDAGHAVVSSFNFLSRAPGETIEVGVEAIVGDGARLASPIALELLQFALDLCPEHVMTLTLMTEPEQWGLERAAPGAAFEIPSLPPELVDEDADEDPWTREARWGIWEHEWRSRTDEIGSALATSCRPAELVRDGDHGQLLWSELRSAKTRLLVTSDQATPEVLTSALLDKLVSKSPPRRVGLAYSRAADALHESVSARLDAHSELVITRCGQEGPPSHAKLLVSDDRALVTSFNLLSFDGDYEGDGRYTLRSEVGVLVRDPLFVRSLCGQLAEVLPSMAAVLEETSEVEVETATSASQAAPTRPSISPEGAARLHGLLSDLRQEGGLGGRTDAIREWLRGGQPWEALPVLQELGFPELPALVARALREYEDESNPHWRSWLLWWTERAWHEDGSVVRVAAALSRLEHRDWSTRLPPAPVAQLLWELRFGELPTALFEELVLEAAGDEVDESSATTLTAMGLELLLRGGAVADTCELLSASAAPPLGEWFEHVERFRVAGWQRPVPIAEVRSHVASADAHRRSEDARAEALQVIAEAGLEGLWDFVKGRETRPFLFENNGSVASLNSSLEASDLQSVRQWLVDHRDIGDLLDEATTRGLAALRPELAGELIVEPRRTSGIRRLRKIRKATKAWADSNPRAAVADDNLWRPTVELAAALQKRAPEFRQLVEQAVRQRKAHGPVLQALETWLDPLLRLDS